MKIRESDYSPSLIVISDSKVETKVYVNLQDSTELFPSELYIKILNLFTRSN
jgi:hypothetical protein